MEIFLLFCRHEGIGSYFDDNGFGQYGRCGCAGRHPDDFGVGWLGAECGDIGDGAEHAGHSCDARLAG